MYKDLTKGNITKTILLFALPMTAGNLLQQLYNVADTLIVGKFIGSGALAAVGSAYTLMTFITSILLGLSMGAGALFSIYCGEGNFPRLKASVIHAFGLIFTIAAVLNILAYIFTDPIMGLLRVPADVYPLMREYLVVIFAGICATFLYNFFSCLQRALGNSSAPLIFLGISAVLNIILDLFFVAVLNYGVAGAAWATVISQYAAGIGTAVYTLIKSRMIFNVEYKLHFDFKILKEIFSLSILTCLQQSVMNFGILMVQGLINSFGAQVMAAYAAAVKIDSFAYMPVQDFGNAFSTFAAQNYGALRHDRIQIGVKRSVLLIFIFCAVISTAVIIFAKPLMLLFVESYETQIIDIGAEYLRCVGAFYFFIGILFLFYGYFRAVKHPGISVVLTVISLGMRVALAYILSARFQTFGIWISIPIGWLLADIAGFVFYKSNRLK